MQIHLIDDGKSARKVSHLVDFSKKQVTKNNVILFVSIYAIIKVLFTRSKYFKAFLESFNVSVITSILMIAP